MALYQLLKMGRRLNLPKTMTRTASFVRWGLNICAEFVLSMFVTVVALYRIQHLTIDSQSS